jgi:hypothetical protein
VIHVLWTRVITGGVRNVWVHDEFLWKVDKMLFGSWWCQT